MARPGDLSSGSPDLGTDVLSEDERPLMADERADMVALADRMHMGDRVPHALAFCPER